MSASMSPLSISMSNSVSKSPAGLWTAGLLFAFFPIMTLAQAAGPVSTDKPAQASPATVSPSAVSPTKDEKAARQPSSGDKRRAVKLFLDASKLFEKEKFEEAMQNYEQAAKLDPSNANYALAADLARSHAVTALIQAAAKDRVRRDSEAERAALTRAFELDPRNIQVAEHLHELSDDAVQGQADSRYEQAANTVADAVPFAHPAGVHSFHLHTTQPQVIQQVFKAYGLDATLDDSIRSTLIRFDMDDASFDQATDVLGLVTHSFYTSLDAHRVLVVLDSRANREEYQRLNLETVYLPGLTATELTEIGALAKNVFDAPQSVVDQSSGTLTIRAPEKSLDAFNSTVRELLDGRSQVMLQAQVFQLSHTSNLNTGIQPPQSVSAFNVYTEEQSILNANQSLVQQIISSGLAAPGDTLAILGILLASGQVSSSLFSNGVALFGGGLTSSALAPGAATANLNLNTSDSRELEDMQLHLGDGESATLRSGTRYPIQTSSFSSLSGSVPSIPGLTGAGASGALSSLISNLTSSVPNIPQVEYQDLGLTLKTTANVMRNTDVALTIDLKIVALSGTFTNGNPLLNNQAYSGVITLKQGEGVVLISDLNKQESTAISGIPGLSEIPGLNNITESNPQKSVATLLIVLTPHVIRGTQAAGHSPMMRIDRSQSSFAR
jgi:general secretion pathway protein D